ncbi:glycosyltransferase [Halorhodospira halochloris]|uniref:Glycosyltransferase n=1 Tax=Halorhodospira halochloris TaxID=1052 RepID=A0A0X8X8W6_HALHR|nr:glycosyltransferase family 1 protein [Halorhodospira halochloris]MBK1651413.1 hypothetical protein [Halorhodospira halochloris]MCG5548414.1 glycosyltransferase family 1 protein [Halorhodospira halochloris]BAU57705.1 glycosyltransferase [Halorhodospira halochloris]
MKKVNLHRKESPLRRISIVSETYAPESNGVATTLSHIAAGLRRDGTAVDLVVPRHPARPYGYDKDLHSVSGLPIPGYSQVRCGVVRPRLLEELWQRRTPDGVYIATEGPLGWAALLAAKRLQLPVVSGFHTRFDLYSEHYMTSWLKPLVGAALRYFHNSTATTLVPDKSLAEKLRSQGYRNVELLGRGVDTRLFNPQRRCTSLRSGWGAGEDEPVLIYVGRIAAEKNLSLAVEAFRTIESVRPGARFVLVGDGPMRSALQHQNPDFIFAGERHGEELASYYASADIFLFPSLSETFGNVTLEALASGLPVVAFDYAAASRFVEEGVNGHKVARSYPAAWVQAALGVAMLPPQVRQRWQEAARDSVAALSWQQIARQFAGVIANAGEQNPGTEQGVPHAANFS